jgi:hypothetical protein
VNITDLHAEGENDVEPRFGLVADTFRRRLPWQEVTLVPGQ